MKGILIFILSMLLLSVNSQNIEGKTTSVIRHKQVLRIVNFDQLQKVLNKQDNKLYVVNFWATWCNPCVKELPEFMEVNEIYRNNQRFKMILVNLDNSLEIDSRIRPFLQKKNINTDVYILDDNTRMNEWIPAVNKNWTGAIPATVLYRNGKQLDFKEDIISKSELTQLIKHNLND